jgi:uncharacterized protein (UPF0332 family)
MSLTTAREHLGHAKKQLDDAAVDSYAPEDPESCVTNVFYAYENVVVALAEAFDIKWKKNHFDKADVAAQLAKDGRLSKDLSQLMLRLNELRKNISYGEPGDDLLDEDLEALVSDLESMIDEADEVISRAEEEETEGTDE